jgi:Fimbrial assembly protein (PilN)
MTATVEKPQEPTVLWQAMPGWGIVADLLPPEIVNQRRIRAIRKYVVIAASTLIVLALLGYGYASWQSHSQSSALAEQQTTAKSLIVQQHKYDGVVQIQGTIAQVQGQIGGLMTDDVDVAKLISTVHNDLPPGGTISQLTVSIEIASANPAAGGASNSGAGIDASGQEHIGTITINGNAPSFAAVSSYVEKLAASPGLVEPFPTNNQATGSGAQFTIAVTITDKLLTHRYAVSAGGK